MIRKYEAVAAAASALPAASHAASRGASAYTAAATGNMNSAAFLDAAPAALHA
jgi:hypothetical protein